MLRELDPAVNMSSIEDFIWVLGEKILFGSSCMLSSSGLRAGAAAELKFHGFGLKTISC